jgi:hypothetical protein
VLCVEGKTYDKMPVGGAADKANGESVGVAFEHTKVLAEGEIAHYVES